MAGGDVSVPDEICWLNLRLTAPSAGSAGPAPRAVGPRGSLPRRPQGGLPGWGLCHEHRPLCLFPLLTAWLVRCGPRAAPWEAQDVRLLLLCRQALGVNGPQPRPVALLPSPRVPGDRGAVVDRGSRHSPCGWVCFFPGHLSGSIGAVFCGSFTRSDCVNSSAPSLR